MGGLPAGIPFFRKVNEIKPDYAPAWANLGLALSAEGKQSEAIRALDRALLLDPKLLQARVGRALALQQTYRIKEAYAEFGAVLAGNSEHHEARSGRLLTANYLSGLSRQTVFEEHLAFGQAVRRAPAEQQKSTTIASDPGGRPLRVAFLSADLRSHSVAYFLEPILKHLDRNRFEIILYHDHFVVDAMSERLRQYASLWRNFVGQLHDNVERVIRADAPDILIDLAGHTGVSRLPLFARRLAPVQITYLGYPNTTGLREMDFRFIDAVTDPGPEDDRFHTEKLVRFAPCAWAFQPPAAAPEPVRTQQPEPSGAPSPLVFGSFNNFAKVCDDTLELWRRVLASVPGSRLLLKSHGLNDPEISEIVRGKLKSLVDDPARVVLAGRTAGLAEHLALYSQVDIALDTFPYHGTTTTCEALWMGVPLVTLLGDRHAARVSASLLTAAGHPDWIAHSEDEYVRIASELAADSARRSALRTTLREDVRRSVLLDHAGLARCFGAALLACVREKQGG
jgi:predicted O-linked N-acetylglucosamine transferase (SPINDLY family)